MIYAQNVVDPNGAPRMNNAENAFLSITERAQQSFVENVIENCHLNRLEFVQVITGLDHDAKNVKHNQPVSLEKQIQWKLRLVKKDMQKRIRIRSEDMRTEKHGKKWDWILML